MIPLTAAVVLVAAAEPPVGTGGPYCGVYCVHLAAHMLGRPVAVEDLLSQRYVGSSKGSTLDELRAAVGAVGLVGTPMSGLTPASLQTSDHPILLHVRRPGKKMPYAHWVLFVGVEGSQARVIDPPGGVELVSFAELSALWDGIGLVVSQSPPSTAALRVAAWAEAALLVAVVGLALLLLRLCGPARPGGLMAGAGVVLAGLAAGVTHQALDRDGLLRNADAVGLVAHQHFQPTLLEVTRDEVRSLAGRPDVAVVDARLTADYRRGHIPGAVSLPVVAGVSERRAVATRLPRSGRVVVYCQSAGCAWADSVAADLYYRGHPGVCIYRDGWRGWKNDE